jgi:hypothetical protein
MSALPSLPGNWLPHPNRRTLAVVILAVLAIGGVWVGLVRPSGAGLEQARADLQASELRLEALARDLAMVQSGNVVPSEVLAGADAAAARLLPSGPPSVDAVASVWQKAEEQGLQVVALSAGSPVKVSSVNASLQMVSVQLSVAGPLEGIVNWVRSVEAGPQMAVVSAGSVTFGSEGYQLTADVLVYSTVNTTLSEQLLATAAPN